MTAYQISRYHEGFSHFHQVHMEMQKESLAVGFIMFVCQLVSI